MFTLDKIIRYRNNSKEVVHLSASDQYLTILFSIIGSYNLTLRTDYYASLVRIIIGQQLSVKASRAIWGRLVDYNNSITPEVILGIDTAILSAVGISKAKIDYLHDLSYKVISHNVDLVNIDKLKDHEVKELLMSVKGIGYWTSDMFLIFSLGRRDVLSPQDVGLQRSVKWLYKLSEMPSAEEMKCIGAKWKPYRTIASLYLWEAVNRDLTKTPI